MRDRCLNPANKKYPQWGGRGIAICSRWDEFENFLADMGERPPGTTLDRKDNDGPYSPLNCRWATPAQQRRNQRQRTDLVLYQGQTVQHWAVCWGVTRRAAAYRIARLTAA